MAKRRKSGGYTLTPRRRAALKKAQLASARKRRRRRVAGGVALGAGILAAGAATLYVRRRGSRRQTAPTTPYRPPLPPPKPKRLKLAPQYAKGRPDILRKKRLKRNQKKRMNYWSGRTAKANKILLYDKPGAVGRRHQPKKVGGTPRKNARATPQVRMAAKADRRLQNHLMRETRKRETQKKINNVTSLDSRRGKGKKK